MKRLFYAFRRAGRIITLLLIIFAYPSCKDNIDESAMYTFKGETIYSYLQKSDNYTDFAYILTRVKLSKQSESAISQLLSARGNYTVFAPNNQAIQNYLDSVNLTKNFPIEQISDSLAEYIARNAIIDNETSKAYKTTDFNIGALERKNMDDRYITINFDTIGNGKLATLVNNKSMIIQPDIEASNGMIQGINRVLELSRATIPALIKEAPNLSIFSELLIRTGWADSMKRVRDEDYEVNHLEYGTDLSGNRVKCPEHKYIGYTVFVEPDSVLEAQWGIPAPITQNGIITNLDEIMNVLTKKCQEYYPDATNSDLKSMDNAVNQFVAYHLIPMRMSWDKLIIHYAEMGYGYGTPDALSIDCYEYYETMGGHRRLLKLTEGSQTEGKRINRHAVYDYADYHEKSCDRPGILIRNSNGKYLSNATNGFYYPINQVLVYDKDVPGVVLNERLRWDVASLLPELVTNGYRRVAENRTIYIPNNFFSTLKMSDYVVCRYFPYFASTIDNYQGDEFNIRGQYDFTIKLPPVPNEGTYELRFAAPSNPGFGMAQFYIGTNPKNLQPIGLPVDLRIPASSSVIGWEQDTKDDEHNNENDKVMRNHGYMKPPMHDGITRPGGAPVVESMRNTTSYIDYLRFRKIIWTGRVDPKDVYYIRIKSVLENTEACFLLDYMEWAPKFVYNGSEAEDKW